MSDMDMLIWARGIGLRWALAVFVFGMIVRAFEIFSLGRKRDLSLARTNSPGSGWRTIASRSLMSHGSSVTRALSYTFHFGLLVVMLFFIPHIQLVRNTLGLSWPGLPTPLVDAVALLTLATLLVVLAYRMLDPVKRFLSTFEDYFTLALAFLPLLTGYLAFHHQLLPYTLMLALHILSVELLLVCMPFTKLTHFATLFMARWYNGDIAAKKGVAA